MVGLVEAQLPAKKALDTLIARQQKEPLSESEKAAKLQLEAAKLLGLNNLEAIKNYYIALTKTGESDKLLKLLEIV